jgi:hypothetical protein
MAGIKMKEKNCKKSLKINPTPALSRCKFYFLHRDRCVCVFMCANLDFSNILTRMNGHNPGLFTQKSHEHTHTSDPRENAIQGYFDILFCHRGPNTFSGHIVSFVGLHHRVYRVSGFLSSRPNWVRHPLTLYGVLLFPP